MHTERSIEESSRLRAEGLRDAARGSRARLAAREQAISLLQAQVALLKMSAARMPVPPKVAAGSSARPAASFRGTRVARARVLAPYAAILACVACLELGVGRRSASADADLSDLLRPSPELVSAGHAAAKGGPVLADEDRSGEALLLVQEWTLPGAEVTIGDTLGGDLDLPGGRPPWNVERTGEHGYRVTYQQHPDSPAYTFEADLENGIVWPTLETQELISPHIIALRDAVR
ncbi:MAG: hypothetical protein HYZ74_09515 [Elusimicrobia bacterium]|nr:hypothetical protein [Elusimicrobiota bacterium]